MRVNSFANIVMWSIKLYIVFLQIGLLVNQPCKSNKGNAIKITLVANIILDYLTQAYEQMY